MAKYYGMIGYVTTEEAAPGVWEEKIVEHPHYGDVNRKSRRFAESSNGINDDFIINNELSILMDPYAFEHFQFIKYATFMNAKWKVTNVEVEYPRMTLSLGGLYNENSY